MPILYETSPAEVKQLRRKYRPRTLQVEEAPRWRVVEEYGVSSIYMTPEDLKKLIKENLAKACTEKGATLEYFRVLKMRSEWMILYTNYFCKYETYIKGGSPLALAVIVLILAIFLTALIIFAIWLVKTYIIEPIWGVIPPYAKPILGTLLVVGAGLITVGLGIYIVKSVIPKMRK